MAGGAASQRPIGVVVAPARMERLAVELEALGTAHANESVDIASKVSNLVVAVHFAEGQKVRRGELLVELDGEQARADVAIAEAALKESRSQYDRSRELYSTKVLSESQLDQIEATLKANEARVAGARSRLGDLQIRAPFAGRVGLRRISVGSLVGPGTIITTLDDTDTIKLDFTVPEAFLAAVTPGLVIAARSVSYPDQVFAGKVASVDSRVDPSTRSITVRALVPNPAGLLKPGMFLNVRLARDATDALVVPEQALVPEQGDMFVFVVKDDTAEKRLVRIGQRRVGDVQIMQGILAGDLVVTEGTQKLRDGARVQVLKGAADGPAPVAAKP
jgi:membrane fusion protein (multidrug efflux system)